MLRTYLTTTWNLRYPIIGAPMAYVGRGRLAHAISRAGGLGMIGIGSKESPELIAQEADIARGQSQERFGIGLLGWALATRPELLTAAIAARPFLIAISFSSPALYVEELHRHGILFATQVNSQAEAVEAERAGVDLVIAQGTEAGGHTGQVGSLPLLQAVLDAVQLPVLVAGGIGSPRGVAAALAAGAEGVWVGTRFLASPETEATDQARERIVQTPETGTVLTRAFDIAQGFAWPPQYPGRALSNRFTERWHLHTDELANDTPARQQLAEAIKQRDYEQAHIYAGEAVGLITRQQAAGEIVRELGEGAEQLLRARFQRLLDEG